MTPVPDRAERDGHRPSPLPAEDLNRQVGAVLSHAVDAHRKELKVYKSLRNLNEVVSTEYGDRVLYELIQNAHDAHRADDQGRIAVRLVVRSETDGTLYVANGGSGFRRTDVDAIENLATTAKEIGEGIGNKGLGFRSIEALTDDVRIFSRRGRSESAWFDGYCFRFATVEEIERLLRTQQGIDAATARDVAGTVPRYLVPQPLAEQPADVVPYARRGYASVIMAPLSTAEAIELAKRQVQALTDLDVPLLLFLDRIADFRIDVEMPDKPVHRRRLSRRQTAMGDVPGVDPASAPRIRPRGPRSAARARPGRSRARDPASAPRIIRPRGPRSAARARPGGSGQAGSPRTPPHPDGRRDSRRSRRAPPGPRGARARPGRYRARRGPTGQGTAGQGTGSARGGRRGARPGGGCCEA